MVEHHGASQIWVCGIIDTSIKPAVGCMEIVEKRDAATLLPIIGILFRKGCIIRSNEWKAYNQIQSLGYTLRTANQSLNFVHPETVWRTHSNYRIILE